MSGPDYDRDESRADQLDRNWAELLQELRVIGTGVQVLFAFLLGIAFQARFSQTSSTQRDLYLVTLTFSGMAAALLIAPVAVHRFLFRIGVKDELVTFSNRLAVAGLAVLSLSMVGAVALTTDWVGGSLAGAICGGGAALLFGVAWFGVPFWLRRNGLSRPSSPAKSHRSPIAR